MKILHASYYGHVIGGAEVLLFRILRCLEDQGIQNVFAYQYPSPSKESPWPVYQIDGLGDSSFSNRTESENAFKSVLEKEKPDLIHLHDIAHSGIAAISLAFAPTVQSLYNHNAYCPGGSKLLSSTGRICERSYGPFCVASAFLTHCNSIRPDVLYTSYRRSGQMLSRHKIPLIVLSRYQKKALIQNGFPEEKIFRRAPYTHLPDLSNASAQSSNKIMFAGRVTWQKGWDRLLETLSLLDCDYTLLVDGDGPDIEKMKKKAVQLKIYEKINFLGWQNRQALERDYQTASVIVVPSIWPEPFGIVGIEALSYGKPVVAFNVGGIPDWLEDGVSGYLIPPFDIRQFAEKLKMLLLSPEKAAQMGMNGRRHVEKDFTKEGFVEQLMHIYDNVIKNWKK